MLSSAASAACTLLMIANSALRCSVSFSSRCVSSNRRAFSSAVPSEAAIVVNNRTSASPNAQVGVVEHFAQLVADGVVDRLDVEFRGERRLHAVDDRELGVALLGFLQQSLRFIEQARALERCAE